MLQRIKNMNFGLKDAVPILAFALVVLGEGVFMLTNQEAVAMSPKRLLLTVLGIVSSIAMYVLLKTSRMKVETGFLASLVILGIMDAVAIMPFAAIDEDIHFLYTMSLVGIPADEGASVLPPPSTMHLYLVPGIGAFLGKLIGLDSFWIYYIGSAFSFGCYCICSYFAVRVAPFGKTAFMVISLLPATIFAASSFGYASPLFSVAILQVAFCLKAIVDAQQDKKTLAAIAVLSILLVPCKLVFSLFPLLVLAIPSKSFGSKKIEIAYKAGLIAACFIVLLVTGIRWSDFHYEMGAVRPEGAYSIKEVLGNPPLLCSLIIDALFSDLSIELLGSFSVIQTTSGALSIMQDLESAAYILMFIFALLLKGEGVAIPRSARVASAAILLLSSFGLFLYGSILMTSPTQDTIASTIGPYWTPLLFLFVPLASNTHLSRSAPTPKAIVFATFCLGVFFYIGLTGAL